MRLTTPSKIQVLFIVWLLLGFAVYTRLQSRLLPMHASAASRTLHRKFACYAPEAGRACASSSGVRTLFFVMTTPEASHQRQLVRSTYADPSFAGSIGWQTVFVLSGPPSTKLLKECESYGDVLASHNHLVPKSIIWATVVCPNADLVVKMDHNLLPHPFYLTHYRRTMINVNEDRMHCVVQKRNKTAVCSPLVVLFKGSALRRLYDIVEHTERHPTLPMEDIRSYVAVEEDENLYTAGAVVFFRYNDRAQSNWTTLWRAVLDAEGNDLMDLYL